MKIGSLFSGVGGLERGLVEAPDSWRIAALGNAVVVQCAYVVGKAIADVLG